MVKGKARAVRIFTSLLGTNPEQRQSAMVHQQVFLLAYRGMQWDEAERLAKVGADLNIIETQGYYACMLERITQYRKNPPPRDWDGVLIATEK